LEKHPALLVCSFVERKKGRGNQARQCYRKTGGATRPGSATIIQVMYTHYSHRPIVDEQIENMMEKGRR
jgi:hypothetical protein